MVINTEIVVTWLYCGFCGQQVFPFAWFGDASILFKFSPISLLWKAYFLSPNGLLSHSKSKLHAKMNGSWWSRLLSSRLQTTFFRQSDLMVCDTAILDFGRDSSSSEIPDYLQSDWWETCGKSHRFHLPLLKFFYVLASRQCCQCTFITVSERHKQKTNLTETAEGQFVSRNSWFPSYVDERRLHSADDRNTLRDHRFRATEFSGGYSRPVASLKSIASVVRWKLTRK